MKTEFLLVALLALSLATAQDQAVFARILKTLCVPNLGPELAAKARDCETRIPANYHTMFKACAGLTLGVPELALPLMCYRAFPGAPQLTQCMDAKEKSEGMDAKEKDRFSKDYSECLQKVI